jgi:hypothetical protein
MFRAGSSPLSSTLSSSMIDLVLLLARGESAAPSSVGLEVLLLRKHDNLASP